MYCQKFECLKMKIYIYVFVYLLSFSWVIGRPKKRISKFAAPTLWYCLYLIIVINLRHCAQKMESVWIKWVWSNVKSNRIQTKRTLNFKQNYVNVNIHTQNDDFVTTRSLISTAEKLFVCFVFCLMWKVKECRWSGHKNVLITKL